MPLSLNVNSDNNTRNNGRRFKLKKSNARRIWKRTRKLEQKYKEGKLSKDQVMLSLDGWFEYAKFANTYKLRNKISLRFDEVFHNNKRSENKIL